MSKSVACLAAIVSVVCLSAGASRAGEISRAKLAGSPLSLLGGRLLVRMPAGAEIEATRPSGVFASADVFEEEAVAFFESKGERITLVVSETFARAGLDFERKTMEMAAKGWFGSPSARGKLKITIDPKTGAITAEDPNQLPTLIPWTPSDPREGARVRGVIIVPPALQADGETVQLASVVLVLPDQTVVVISMYANTKAVQDREACQKLATAVFGSFQPGPKRLLLDAGPRQLVLYSHRNALSITVPWNAPITLTRGRNSLVYRIRPICDFGKPCQVLSIYYGGSAAYQYKQAAAESNVAESKGKLLGQDVDWMTWSYGDAPDAVYTTEAMAANVMSDESLPMVLHVIASAPRDVEATALRKVAETLKVVPLVERAATEPSSQPASAPASQPASEPAGGPASAPASMPASMPASNVAP